MFLIEYFNQHPDEFWFTLGFTLLAIEGIVLGFSFGVLLFAGIGALITGGMIHFEILSQDWQTGISSFGVASAMVTAILWMPFRRLQGSEPASKDNTSDLIGLQFRLEESISSRQPGSTRYSGVTWVVELDPASALQSLEAGTMVQVVSVDVARFVVKPC